MNKLKEIYLKNQSVNYELAFSITINKPLNKDKYNEKKLIQLNKQIINTNRKFIKISKKKNKN